MYFIALEMESNTLNILGISDVTGNHSHSSIAILQDNHLAFALSQERISRVKNDSRFPKEAIQAALDYTHLRLNDIDHFACGYPPANYYNSLMQYSKFDVPRAFLGALFRSPKKLSRYLAPNIKKALFDAKNINGLIEMGVPPEKFHFIDHHLAHVSAGYFSSTFDNALAISYGGFAPHSSGQNVAGAVYLCRGDSIEFLEDIPMFAGGTYFSGVAVALGMRYMQQEGKVMGLAATGDYHDCYDRMRKYAAHFHHEHWTKNKNWVDYIMSPREDAFLATKSGRKLSKLIRQYGPADVAAAAQHLWEKNIVRLVNHLVHKYGVHQLVLTGGTFLNIKINSKIEALEEVSGIFVHPHTGDGSTTIGAAIEMNRQAGGKPLRLDMANVGLGIDFTDASIEMAIRRFGSALKYKKIGEPSTYAAGRIAEGKIIGWFHGREEYGPRSLGHRCILADPRNVALKNRINRDIKGRELWLPVAASILAENGDDYFEAFVSTPHMARAFTARPEHADFIKGALHADSTSRVQAVGKKDYKPFRKLLQNFYRRTNMPMVLNSSLNRHGEPIVHRPFEALQLLMDTPLDELIIGNYSVQKGISLDDD
jgi:carbamoyltransferase